MRNNSAFLLVVGLAVSLSVGCAGQGCGFTPLPSQPAPTGFPFDQQIEGGLQARLTSTGFAKVSSILPMVLHDALGAGICLPEQTVIDYSPGGISNAFIKICDATEPLCSNAKACFGDISVNDTSITLEDGNEPVITATVKLDAHVPIHFHASISLFGSPLYDDSCNLIVETEHYSDPSATETELAARIKLSIEQVTGKLKIQFIGLNVAHLGLVFSGCGLLSTALDYLNEALGYIFSINEWIHDFLGVWLTDYLIQLLQPQIDSLISSFLPDPPGLAGVLSMGTLLSSMQAPSDANLELYLVAGGYVQGYNGGLNLGVVSGINSDRDLTSRTPTTWSEPNLCVPARPAPDLSQAPWTLPVNPTRNDHMLIPADEFSGRPDPTVAGSMQDFALGMSRTFLDLAGFHVFNSGTLCLTVGGATLKQLDAGALSVLLPSLANLIEDRRAPITLAIRPEQPIRFTVGAGTAADPLLHVQVTDLRVDFYVFIEERYVRIFTLAADLNVGLGLSLDVDDSGNPTVQPTISGIDKNSVQLRITNTDLLQEDPTKLAALVGSLLDVVVGQIAGIIKPMPLPSMAGLRLKDLSIGRVQTWQDDFVAIFGSLIYDEEVGLRLGAAPLPPPSRVVTRAHVAAVSVPGAVAIREALAARRRDEAALPAVTLELGAEGTQQTALEWSFRIDGSAWHSWSPDPRPTLSDATFLLQARHVVEVRARQYDRPGTEDTTPVRLEVLIDSIAPDLTVTLDGRRLVFHGRDNVSLAGALRYSWRTTDGWQTLSNHAELALDQAWSATHEGREPLEVAVIDEAGNRSATEVHMAQLMNAANATPPPSGGCSLGGSGSSGGGWMLFSLIGLGLLGWRRRHRRRMTTAGWLPLAAFALAATFQAGCSCSGSSIKSCNVDDDCRTQACPAGQLPKCQEDGTCGCAHDTPLGDIGRFSSLAMVEGEAYVAAYNNTYGDLMIGHVAPPGVVGDWEFVDGIPLNAPSTNPLSQVRGGISEKGDDVGRYASIAAAGPDHIMIAYYDATHGTLKLASFGSSRWTTHVVDAGNGSPVTGGDDIGRWTSLTLASDGTPGIAYYAEVAAGDRRMSQLRFAQANGPDPQSQEDWVVTVIESRALPEVVADAPIDVLPNGIALFVSAARMADGRIVIAYYDRQRGNLRFVEGEASGTSFGTPIILDGETPEGRDLGDVGQYPSVIAAGTTSYVSYVDSTHRRLLFIETAHKTPEVVDNGYRPGDEKTLDGLDAPVYHRIGDSSSILVVQERILIAYQDSTTVELRLAQRDPATHRWALSSVAGHADPFTGAYGFYAQLRVAGNLAVLSSYGINQHLESPIFFVETFALDLGLVL